jgi:hypothetical protein
VEETRIRESADKVKKMRGFAKKIREKFSIFGNKTQTSLSHTRAYTMDIEHPYAFRALPNHAKLIVLDYHGERPNPSLLHDTVSEYSEWNDLYRCSEVLRIVWQGHRSIQDHMRSRFTPRTRGMLNEILFEDRPDGDGNPVPVRDKEAFIGRARRYVLHLTYGRFRGDSTRRIERIFFRRATFYEGDYAHGVGTNAQLLNYPVDICMFPFYKLQRLTYVIRNYELLLRSSSVGWDAFHRVLQALVEGFDVPDQPMARFRPVFPGGTGKELVRLVDAIPECVRSLFGSVNVSTDFDGSNRVFVAPMALWGYAYDMARAVFATFAHDDFLAGPEAARWSSVGSSVQLLPVRRIKLMIPNFIMRDEYSDRGRIPAIEALANVASSVRTFKRPVYLAAGVFEARTEWFDLVFERLGGERKLHELLDRVGKFFVNFVLHHQGDTRLPFAIQPRTVESARAFFGRLQTVYKIHFDASSKTLSAHNRDASIGDVLRFISVVPDGNTIELHVADFAPLEWRIRRHSREYAAGYVEGPDEWSCKGGHVADQAAYYEAQRRFWAQEIDRYAAPNVKFCLVMHEDECVFATCSCRVLIDGLGRRFVHSNENDYDGIRRTIYGVD